MAEIPRPNHRFAANLRKLREAAGLSQEALAFRSALHRTQISLLENGGRMPRVHTLVCLAGALGATPNDLLDGITWEPVVATGGGLVVTPPRAATMAEVDGRLGASGRFAANLRGLREAAGLSQEELAFRSEIHRTQVSFIESGDRMPRLDTLVKLAGALGATPNDLLDGITWEPAIHRRGRFTAGAGEGGADGQ